MRPEFGNKEVGVVQFPVTPEAQTRLQHVALKDRLARRREEERKYYGEPLNQPRSEEMPTEEKTAAAAEKKQIKKLTIKIEDPDAVFAAYPAFKKENFLKAEVDKSRLRKAIRPIVNALYDAGQQVPGVNAYYAHEKAEGEAPEAAPAHNQMA